MIGRQEYERARARAVGYFRKAGMEPLKPTVAILTLRSIGRAAAKPGLAEIDG